MPRANRPHGRRRSGSAAASRSASESGQVRRLGAGLPRRAQYAGLDWFVRPLTGRSGESANRGYRCPGCSQEIAATTAHVVVWPADAIGSLGGVADRRHWHTACWDSRDRRRPEGSYR